MYRKLYFSAINFGFKKSKQLLKNTFFIWSFFYQFTYLSIIKFGDKLHAFKEKQKIRNVTFFI